MTTASKSIASYWDGDSWEDFAVSGVTRLYAMTISDSMNTPRIVNLVISNHSTNPQANSGGSAKGPYTGVVGDFTPIKIRDKDSGEIYFYGAATRVRDDFSEDSGMLLRIKAEDYLFELRDQVSAGKLSFRQIANDRALVATLNEALDNSETEITVTDTTELFPGMRITFASNDEEMLITKINSGTSIDVVRGVNGEFDTHSSSAAMFESATPTIAFVPNGSPKNTSKKQWNRAIGSRGGLIKSFIENYTDNIRHPGPSVQVNEAIDASETELTVIDSTGMFVGQILKVDNEELLVTAVTDKTTITVEREYRGTTAATHSDKAILQAVDDRFDESITNYVKNGILKLSSQGEKSILKHIIEQSDSEPHYALTADQNSFGYDFYMSPNITSTGDTLPTAYFDYFKKGTRPTSETLGPTAFGLNLHYPSPDTITNGSFVTTGRQYPMSSSTFESPKKDVYTDAVVQFNAVSRGDKGDAVAYQGTETFEVLEVYNVNGGSDFAGFAYPGKNIAGGVSTGLSFNDSAEPFATVMTQINMGSGVGTGDTTLTVDSTTDMYVGQIIFLGAGSNPEQILITSIDSGTQITVQRAQGGTSAATATDDALVRTIVGRIQYLSSGTNGVNADPAVETAFMLVSELDQSLQDSTVVWGTASAVPALNVFYGVNSGYAFNLKAGGRPRIKLGVRRTSKMKISATTDPDTIREQIMANLMRNQNPPVRGEIETVFPPHFYIDNVPSAVSGSGTAEITIGNTLLTGTLNEGLDTSETDISVTDSTGMYVGQRIKIDSEEFAITAVNSKILITATRAQNSTSAAEHTSGAAIYDSNVDLTKYGFRTGMCINELDSNNQPTGTFGYATWVSSAKVKVTWATGSVDTSSTLRYYIPVRAGDTMRVRNDISNVDTTVTVTGYVYEEGSGRSSTKYNIVESTTALVPNSAPKSAIVAAGTSAATDDNLPSAPELAADANVLTTCTFSSTSASQVNWGSGNLYVGADVYAIDAGDSSSLSALNSDGRVYYVYYVLGESIFRVIDDGDYAALVQEQNDADLKIIAEINYDLPYAVWRLVGIKGGFAQSSSPTSIPNAPRYYGDDGGAILPSYSFSSDTDTGMYRSALAPSIAFAVAGSARAFIYSAGIQTTMTSSGSAGTVLHGDTNGLIYKFTSSERYKKNIVDAALDSAKIYDMRPVEYENNENSKEGDEGKKGFGLIAEEVHELFPEIVIYDEEGKPDSISYDRISVLLLMEIKKLKEEIEKLKENN
jgi:hypothetical protein